ncbi:hypothetical protein GCM10011409_18880 [Lentibacillus populi]|uniref:Uncharacterized protein n=1 Tax=Lentibacillus populi TaxID=1827502 RepID=A0A9W5X587_9BACI|nr:hypothetical protein [Lentibacillus populi]GGB41591.1 hypothetical protein GCM10011409_18880 [Lentibacillus populi]
MKPFHISLDRFLWNFTEIINKDLVTEKEINELKYYIGGIKSEINTIDDKFLLHDSFMEFIIIKKVVRTIEQIIEDTEHFEGIKGFDITALETCQKLIGNFKNKIDDKMEEVEKYLKISSTS